MTNVFEPFPKIPRFSKAGGCCITEKIDGTNAQLYITEELFKEEHTARVGDYYIYCGSRNRLITPEDDNYGFAAWVKDNAEDLINLGVGRHYGEWWGNSIQRNYGLRDRRFSLFNVNRWSKPDVNLPTCVSVVPVLYRGIFETSKIKCTLEELRITGSMASEGYMNPEGIVIYQYHTEQLFKMTYDGDNHKYES